MLRAVLHLVLALAALSTARAAEPINLVANGDFSRTSGGKPEPWITSGSPRNVTQSIACCVRG
jgi:hypothetical protein